ncbi:ABC transporter substrate-binding protein [Alphaproteobacteria bacterium]|nr:ABC transporter substrate-binding protein [Alphaproteobacteria bacterium]
MFLLNKNNFFCLFFIILSIFIHPSFSKATEENWNNILKQASGQTIYFHAWGGAKNINSYINWAGDAVKKAYNITVKHVKVSDTSHVVSRILSEKNSKIINNGAVDLVWINGENFSSMKKNNLLLNENWIFQLPNSKFLDFKNNPSLLNDFGISTDGMEMPWGVSQLNFYYDSKYIKVPPKSALKLKKYILKNKGRFTFPQPPDFVGTSFLKQILIELIADKNVLKLKFVKSKHEKLLYPLFHWLDEVTPHLWRNGKNYPSNYLALTELVADREIDIGMAFNIAHASNAISEGKLKKTIKSYIHEGGTLANVHFLSIPYNSSNIASSKVFVNFLISPEAQIKKQNNFFWGDPSVLSSRKLTPIWKNKLLNLPRGPATLSNEELEVKLEEPHPSWVKIIEDKWIQKYGSNN